MDFSIWIIAQQGGGGELMSTLAMFGVIFLIFWFFLIRPQNKELRRHQALVSSLKKGDQVVTAGGVFGKIKTVNEHTVELEIARGTKIEIERQKIQKTREEFEVSAKSGTTTTKADPKESEDSSSDDTDEEEDDDGKKKKKAKW